MPLLLQGLARALWANNQMATELQLRLAAIKEGDMPGARPEDFLASLNKVSGPPPHTLLIHTCHTSFASLRGP